jgi:hypothetical protein
VRATAAAAIGLEGAFHRKSLGILKKLLRENLQS